MTRTARRGEAVGNQVIEAPGQGMVGDGAADQHADYLPVDVLQPLPFLRRFAKAFVLIQPDEVVA